MDIPTESLLKFLIVGGALAFILLLISFQYILAVVVLIVTIVAYLILRQPDNQNS